MRKSSCRSGENSATTRSGWPTGPGAGCPGETALFEVLNELSGPPSDVLRLRVSAPDATLGNLPLDEGLRLLRGGRDMLLSAACSTIRPQAFHPEKSLESAQRLHQELPAGPDRTREFRRHDYYAGPSIAPTDALPGDDEFEEVLEPFARRVTTRLMGSLEIVDNAVRNTRLDPILGGSKTG